jgi:hypothetical protein
MSKTIHLIYFNLDFNIMYIFSQLHDWRLHKIEDIILANLD